MPRRNHARHLRRSRARRRLQGRLRRVEPIATPHQLALRLVLASKANRGILGPIGLDPLGGDPPKVHQTQPQGRPLSGARLSKLFDGSEAGT
jgi:hypothetical protein